MKLRVVVMVLSVLALSAGALQAEEMKHEMHMSMAPNAGFERLKELMGAWETATESGKPTTATYELTAGGSALMERLNGGDEPEMVTMYSPDGPSVMMTHYCGMGNQPRMRARNTKADPATIDFGFVDCANLSAPTAGHMHHLMVTFQDKDHFTQEWTWKEKGKDQKFLFHFARKVS